MINSNHTSWPFNALTNRRTAYKLFTLCSMLLALCAVPHALCCLPDKKDKIGSILADFAATDLYEEDFLKYLEEGLKKSSVYG